MGARVGASLTRNLRGLRPGRGLGDRAGADSKRARAAACESFFILRPTPGSKPLHTRFHGGRALAAERIRRAVMNRFPYLIAFEGHADHILILAIGHGKRRPLYWLARDTRLTRRAGSHGTRTVGH